MLLQFVSAERNRDVCSLSIIPIFFTSLSFWRAQLKPWSFRETWQVFLSRPRGVRHQVLQRRLPLDVVHSLAGAEIERRQPSLCWSCGSGRRGRCKRLYFFGIFLFFEIFPLPNFFIETNNFA